MMDNHPKGWVGFWDLEIHDFKENPDKNMSKFTKIQVHVGVVFW